MSDLVTQTGPVAQSRGSPPAKPAPGPHARGRGSSSGSGVWTASAPGLPPCSPCGRGRPSSTAGAAHCAGPGGTTSRSSGTCVVFASSSAPILQPPMMRTSAPQRDLRRRRAEENEEGFTGSFSKKTPPKKTGRSHRWNQHTFRSVMASRQHVRQGHLEEQARVWLSRSRARSRRLDTRHMRPRQPHIAFPLAYHRFETSRGLSALSSLSPFRRQEIAENRIPETSTEENE